MTLLTEHLEAGWHEVEHGEFGKWVAERVHARPGATSSVIRVEADTLSKLQAAVTLRQSQLQGTEEPTKDTTTNDGTLVTGEQHEALKTVGLVVAGPEAEATADEDAAARDAEIESLRAQLAEAQAAPSAAESPVETPVSGPAEDEQPGATPGAADDSAS